MSSPAARYFPGIFARRNGNGAHEQISSASCDEFESHSEDVGIAEAEISDEALILRLQGKDISALGFLYRRYARAVYSVCARIIRDSAEAEDLVHEVFLALYKRCASFDAKKGTARSWLLQLTYHKCFDWRDYLKARHGFHQGNGERKSPATPPELVEEQGPMEQTISVDEIRVLLARLPREQQLTFRLRVLTYLEETMEASGNGAAMRLSSMLRRLRVS